MYRNYSEHGGDSGSFIECTNDARNSGTVMNIGTYGHKISCE
jgi:hypothetical protein